MKIRNKILIYFSNTVIAVSGISLIIIYILFSEYREEEFQQRLKEKVQHTIKILSEYKLMDEAMFEVMDKLSIQSFYDEKTLIFDKHKNLIYESIDDLPITNYHKILNELSPNKIWLETKEGKYDLIGVYIDAEHSHYYAVSKAYDKFGYSKLAFLRNTLIVIFIVIFITVILVALYLSKKISQPLVKLVDSLNQYDFNKETKYDNNEVAALTIVSSTNEINQLVETFNKLIKRTNETFIFQKNAIHHISHELKTPIAILVSELERINNNDVPDNIKTALNLQINKAKSLGDIINVLLEISKIETKQYIAKKEIRIDELIFDLIDELNKINPDFVFEQSYVPDVFIEKRLEVKGNKLLLKQAFLNVLSNCINYADNKKAQILINCSSAEKLVVQFSNSGQTVKQEEQAYLFDYFFRGENSSGKSGFGLGLVLAKKILTLHHGKISYKNEENNCNLFEISLPLS